MRAQSVTAIALAIVILTAASNTLFWLLKGEKLQVEELLVGLGTGCVLAAAWVLFAAILNMFMKNSR